MASALGTYEVDTIVLDNNETVMRALPENCIDFAMTSPPYFNWRDYAHWNTYLDYLDSVKEWFTLLMRVMKPGRRVVWNVPVIAGEKYSDGLLALPHETVVIALRLGWLFRQEIIWDDPAGKSKWPTGSFPFGPSVLMRRSIEHLLVFQKPAPEKPVQYDPLPPELKPYNLMDKHFFRDRISKQVWMIPPRNGSDGHDAAYPEALVDPCIRMWSRPGEIVFDPFMGSGTTALSAMRWKRHFFGCEWTPKYHALCQRNIQQRLFELAHEQMTMETFFPEANTKPTYDQEVPMTPEQLSFTEH